MNRWFVVSLCLTVLALGVSAYLHFLRFDLFPDRVPIHWNANFDADGWVPRERFWPVMWGVPAGMALFCGLTILLPKISPKKFTLDTFQDTYHYTMGLVVGLLCYLHFAVLWGTLHSEGHKAIFMKVFLGGMCLFFALIGNVMGKVRRNFWMGVRTPWTIASEKVWNCTHRLAAWLFVSAGVGSFFLVLLLPVSLSMVAVIGMLVLIAAAAIIPVIYSAVLYKRLERAGELEPNDGAS